MMKNTFTMNSFFETSGYNENIFNKQKENFADLWKSIRETSFLNLKQKWQEFKTTIKNVGIEQEIIEIFNKHFKTSFNSFNDIPEPNEEVLLEDVLYEDWKHWWEKVKTEIFPALSFYPALQAWLEIDKVIKNQNITFENVLVIAVYGIFWVALISLKYSREWLHWKKKNPHEYELEQMEKRRTKKAKKLKKKVS